MSYINAIPLSSFLSSNVVQGPPTSALALLQGLDPVSFNFDNVFYLAPRYSVGIPSVIKGLSGSQKKYQPILQSNGFSSDNLLALLLQAFLDTQPITLTVESSDPSGTTVDLTPYGFSNTPMVFLTAFTTAGRGVTADLISVTPTTLEFITKNNNGFYAATANVLIVPVF